jgi:hypothetical protein
MSKLMIVMIDIVSQVRLLMCYCATHPEKLDATKQQQWQKLAMLSPEDMATITNLEFIGVPVRKRSKATGLNFGRKRKRAVRKVGFMQLLLQTMLKEAMLKIHQELIWYVIGFCLGFAGMESLEEQGSGALWRLSHQLFIHDQVFHP